MTNTITCKASATVPLSFPSLEKTKAHFAKELPGVEIELLTDAKVKAPTVTNVTFSNGHGLTKSARQTSPGAGMTSDMSFSLTVERVLRGVS